MRLMRFLFYLGPGDTERFLLEKNAPGRRLRDSSPEMVRQNCQGGTIAVERAAYFHLGGHDEGFTGWGGEDNEFFDRCRLLRFHPWGYLPFVHLWHVPQTGKGMSDGRRAHLEEVLAVPAEARRLRLIDATAMSPADSYRGVAT